MQPSADLCCCLRRLGPLSLAEMADKIYSAEVVDSTPVWALGMGGWARLCDTVARFSWPKPLVEDRSPMAGGRPSAVTHKHEEPLHQHEREPPADSGTVVR